MHYLIDGYNLLFRLTHSKKNLQSERQALIYDLNQKVLSAKLDVTLIFDAKFQLGDRNRSHFDALEILFTAYGETADEYILEELSRMRSTHQETVVTSDKYLAWRARHLGAHIQSVEEFFQQLNRVYKNKSRPVKQKKTISTPVILPDSSAQPLLNVPTSDAPLTAYSEYYLQIFEAEWQELSQQQERVKQLKKNAKPTKRHPKKRPSTFPQPPPLDISAKTDVERWLKIFEEQDSYPPQFPNT